MNHFSVINNHGIVSDNGEVQSKKTLSFMVTMMTVTMAVYNDKEAEKDISHHMASRCHPCHTGQTPDGLHCLVSSLEMVAVRMMMTNDH